MRNFLLFVVIAFAFLSFDVGTVVFSPDPFVLTPEFLEKEDVEKFGDFPFLFSHTTVGGGLALFSLPEKFVGYSLDGLPLKDPYTGGLELEDVEDLRLSSVSMSVGSYGLLGVEGRTAKAHDKTWVSTDGEVGFRKSGFTFARETNRFPLHGGLWSEPETRLSYFCEDEGGAAKTLVFFRDKRWRVSEKVNYSRVRVRDWGMYVWDSEEYLKAKARRIDDPKYEMGLGSSGRERFYVEVGKSGEWRAGVLTRFDDAGSSSTHFYAERKWERKFKLSSSGVFVTSFGGRVDLEHGDSGEFTPVVAFSWSTMREGGIGKYLKIQHSFYVRAPTIFERFGNGFSLVESRQLKPEKGTVLLFSFKSRALSVHAIAGVLWDQITFVRVSPTAMAAVNSLRSGILGAGFVFRSRGWSLSGEVSASKDVSPASPYKGKFLPSAPLWGVKFAGKSGGWGLKCELRGPVFWDRTNAFRSDVGGWVSLSRPLSKSSVSLDFTFGDVGLWFAPIPRVTMRWEKYI